jgi:hypothetical protein
MQALSSWKKPAAELQIGQQLLDRLDLGLQLGQVGLELCLALSLCLKPAVELATVVARAPAAFSFA